MQNFNKNWRRKFNMNDDNNLTDNEMDIKLELLIKNIDHIKQIAKNNKTNLF